MIKYHTFYEQSIKTKTPILITEQNIQNELKIRLILEGHNPSDEELNEISKTCMEIYNEGWKTHGALHVLGAIDPSGLVDLGHGIWYLTKGQNISAILTFVGCIPYLGDAAKFLIPLSKGGKALKMVPGGPTLSLVKMLLNKMPIIQKGLTKLVARMLKNPSWKQTLISAFGKPTSMTTKYATTGRALSKVRPQQMANHITNHIVNKMMGPLDKFLRMLAGAHKGIPGIRASSSIGRIIPGQIAKGAVLNMDLSGVPYLDKFSTAPTNKDTDAAYDFMIKNSDEYRRQQAASAPGPRVSTPQQKTQQKKYIKLSEQ